MLKNRNSTGDPIITDDKPRKKLSFRDPEVVSPPRNGPQSAPSVVLRGSPSLQRHPMLRPHSISVTSGVSATSPPSSPVAVNSTRNPMVRSVPNSPATQPKLSFKNHHRHDSWDTSPKPNDIQVQKTQSILSPNHKPPKGRSPTKLPSNSPLGSSEPVSLEHFLSMEDLSLENQAMKVVRTVGQAFEVCHKMSVKEKSPEPTMDEISQGCSEASSDKPKRDEADSESGHEDLLTLTSSTYHEDSPPRPTQLEPLSPPINSDLLMRTGETFTSPLTDPLPMGEIVAEPGTPLSMHHELQLMREQLEQQQQQTHAAAAQVHLLRDQLAAESAARLEAQARAHQLLVHNKELLEHIQQLVLQIRELEIRKTPSPRVATQHSPTMPDVANQDVM